MATQKLLRRSFKNRSLLGVCGGLGEYFNIDPVVIRVGWVLLTLASGIFPGAVAYFVIGLIMPESSS